MFQLFNIGSPPRGRGKVAPVCVGGTRSRITPAWAGKRILPGSFGFLFGDHPRVGGEKYLMEHPELYAEGSPPRGRGKGATALFWSCRSWITPAWAGKSVTSGSECESSRDHPRVGGEKHQDHPRVGGEKPVAMHSSMMSLGSPPRGRGKVWLCAGPRPHLGITPAWAGKRGPGPVKLGRSRDHPRVGGEKLSAAAFAFAS